MSLSALSEVTIEQLNESARTMLRAGASMYMHLAEGTIRAFRRDGETTVRAALREYGKWRGQEMHLAHKELGFPINMETLIRYWDSASTYIADIESNGEFTPSRVVIEVDDCPASEVWRSNNFWRWGHVYCDEFHQSCAAAYHPDGNVVIPKNMMKGDPKCIFHWIMPAEREDSKDRIDSNSIGLSKRLSENYRGSQPKDQALNALKRGSRRDAGRYYTFAQQLQTKFPKHGDEVIRRALHKWSCERGRLLRNSHMNFDFPIILQTLFRNFDYPYQYVWEAKDYSVKGNYFIEISYCPFAELWEDVGYKEKGALFCENTYQPLLDQYIYGAAMKLERCLCYGDASCVLSIVEPQ